MVITTVSLLENYFNKVKAMKLKKKIQYIFATVNSTSNNKMNHQTEQSIVKKVNC